MNDVPVNDDDTPPVTELRIFDGSDRELLEAIQISVGALRKDVAATTETAQGLKVEMVTSNRVARHRVNITRIAVALLGVLLVVFFIGFLSYRADREASRQKGACDNRESYIDLANAAAASPTLVLDAIRNNDARLSARGLKPCGGISLCKDGWYSTSVGRGSCSSHGGQLRILIPDP